MALVYIMYIMRHRFESKGNGLCVSSCFELRLFPDPLSGLEGTPLLVRSLVFG